MMMSVYILYKLYGICNGCFCSYEDHEPCDEEVKEEDGVDGNYVLILLDNHIHKGNRAYIRKGIPSVDHTKVTAAMANFNKKIVMPTCLRK